MKISDLNYDGVCIESSLLTESDWIKINKVFLPNSLYREGNYINLYLHEDKLYYLDLSTPKVQKLSINQFRNLFNKIQNKLK